MRKTIEISGIEIPYLYSVEDIKNDKDIFGFIYITINKISKRMYLGQKRIKGGRNWITYLGSGVAIKDAINKYGKDNFYKIIIDISYSPETLNELEYIYTKLFDCVKSNNWYNLCYGGNAPKGFHRMVSDEERKHLSEINRRGNHHSARKTVCDNIIFDCGKSCAEYYGINPATMKEWLNRSCAMPKEFYDKGLRYLDTDFSQYKYQTDKCGKNNGFYGKSHTESFKKQVSKRLSVKVKQIDKNTNEVLRVWNSISDFAKQNNIKHFSSISRACKNKTTAYGYKWEYVDENHI